MDAVDPLPPVAVRMTPLNNDVQNQARQTHHWYDQIYSIFASIIAYIRGWGDVQAYKLEHDIEVLTPGMRKLIRRGARLLPCSITDFEPVLQGLRERPFVFVQNYQQAQFSHQLAALETANDVRDTVLGVLPDMMEEHVVNVPVGVVKKGALVFVPLIIGNGMFEAAHIVWVTADLKAGRVEYFDPKGKELVTDEDGNVEVNRDAKHRMTAGVIAALAQKYFVAERQPDPQFVQNPVRHQYDIHSCGVHGLKYMSARTQLTMTFEKYAVEDEFDIAATRRDMAKAILDYQDAHPVEEADLVEIDEHLFG